MSEIQSVPNVTEVESRPIVSEIAQGQGIFVLTGPHADTHLPSGSDPLATATAVEITDSTNAEGAAESFARSNHTHAHGNRAGGTLHAIATVAVAGFLSAADKVLLDAAVPDSRTLTAGAGLTGGGDLTADRTFNAAANADGSIVVNANDIQVGVLATDAQHGARGGGTQHAVATVGVAGFMSAADKTALDAHLIDVANPHVTTLQLAYDDSPAGGPHIDLDATREGFHLDGTALAAGSAGAAGPDYFRITRGGVNILNTAYNATDLRATVYSTAINGLDIAPDPGVFPGRSTISVAVDKLRFLRQDRTITALPGGFFVWDSTITLDFTPSTTQGFITLAGTFEFAQSASGFGMGNAILHSATWKNANAVVANLGPGFLFANNAVYQADAAAITMPQARIFFDNSTYNVINGGTLTGLSIGHVSYWSSCRVDSGASLVQRRGLFFTDAFGIGTIGTQVAVDIEPLARGTTNIGIRSAMTAANGDFINSVGATAPARFGGEVEVDGNLNHDGANVGFYGAVPVAQAAAYTVTNVTPDRAYDADLTTINELADILGTLIGDLQAVGLVA